jgi:hypothetical protein
MGMWRKCQRILGIGGRRRDLPADVYLVSFPKCGRTWLTLLIGRAVQQHFGLDGADPLHLRKLGDLRADVPRIAPTHDELAHWKRPDELSADKSRYKGKKVIFLVRDPRDTFVSNYFQKKKRVKESRTLFLFRKRGHERRVPFEGELADFMDFPIGGFDSLLGFLGIWERERTTPAGFLLVRYEDLHEDPHRELRRALEFAGVTGVSDEVVDEAVRFASFDSMHKMEKEQAFKVSKMRPADKNDGESFKTRKGKVGGYVDYLTEEQIAELNRKMAATLSAFYGYEPCITAGDS